MLITDQVATAPCTDRVQARRPIFEAKPSSSELYHSQVGGNCVYDQPAMVQFENTPKALANFSPVVGAKRQPWVCK
jgi:hypothetical protein